ncbi:MAG TPA: histidine kinase [Burkholderiales bacterium]
MSLTATGKEIGAGIASVYRRYAAWLVGISWKRFILLSILLMIAAGVLSGLPPFSWDVATRTVKSTRPVHVVRPDVDIKIDKNGVRIHRKANPDTGKPARDITIDQRGVQIDGKDLSAPPPPPAPDSGAADDIKAELAGLGEEIRQEVAEAMSEIGSQERVVHVRLGNYLPGFAFLFIMLSAVIKIAYTGRVKAEARAAEAQGLAEEESLKRQVAEAKMAALQAQVEPHFLFNTLASIDHLIEVDPPRASKMQKNLIALLRASMPAMREKAATLGRELEVVRPYLEILKVRMEQRLRAEISIPEGLYSADFPPMMLQSLVENAIKHGLEPKAEGGALEVRAEVVHGKLEVTVSDTGVGFGRAATAGDGTGLENIRERLKLLYGGAAELRISANTPSGTRASVVVPYKAT